MAMYKQNKVVQIIIFLLLVFSLSLNGLAKSINPKSNIDRVCSTVKKQLVEFNYYNAKADTIKTTPVDLNPETEADFSRHEVTASDNLSEIDLFYASKPNKIKNSKCDGFGEDYKTTCFFRYRVFVEFTEDATNCGYEINRKMYADAWIRRFTTEESQYYQNAVDTVTFFGEKEREYKETNQIEASSKKGLRNRSCHKIKEKLTADPVFAAFAESIKYKIQGFETSDNFYSIHRNFNGGGINIIAAVNGSELSGKDRFSYPMQVSYIENASKCKAVIDHTNPVYVDFDILNDTDDGDSSRGFTLLDNLYIKPELPDGFKITYNPDNLSKAIDSVRGRACERINTIAWNDGAIGTSENLVFTIPEFGKDILLLDKNDNPIGDYSDLKFIISNIYAGYRQDCMDCTGETIPRRLYGSVPFDLVVYDDETSTTYSYEIRQIPTITYLQTTGEK